MTSSNFVASGDPSSATPNVRWNHRGSPQYNSFIRISLFDLFFNDLLSSIGASQPSSQPTWICGTHDPHDVQLLLGFDRLLDLFDRW